MKRDAGAAATLNERELRQYLKEHLPEPMVPTVFFFLEEMPLLRNGKVDLQALAALKRSRPDAGATYLEPETQTERIIAAAWRKVLKIENVGANENFFEIGGHSLLLLEVSQELRQKLGREITIVSLFQYPTIELLAKYLSGEQVEEDLLSNGRQRARKRARALRRQEKLAQVRRNIGE